MIKNFKKNNNKQQPKQVFLQRGQCQCIAQKHELINNCLNCGRVVCAREGQGPCFFCGNIVQKPDSNYMINNDTNIFPTLPKQQLNKALQERSEAIIHRNKLVERDKTKEGNQNIYDEQLDYYQMTQNQWLDENDRQAAVQRILQKDKTIQSDKLTYRVQFDPITGQFIRVQQKFDEEAFKNEGQKFAQQKQLEQFKKKNQITKQIALDKRVLTNEKMKSIVEGLNIGKNAKPEIKKQLNQHLVEFIIQQQEQKQQP